MISIKERFKNYIRPIIVETLEEILLEVKKNNRLPEKSGITQKDINVYTLPNLRKMEPFMKHNPNIRLALNYASNFGTIEDIKIEGIKEVIAFCKSPQVNDQFKFISEIGVHIRCVDDIGKDRHSYVRLNDFNTEGTVEQCLPIFNSLKNYLETYPEYLI